MDGNDAMEQRDEADRQKTIVTVTATNQAAYYVFRSDMSLDSGTNTAAKPKMITIVHCFIKPGSVAQFTRINAAIAKTKYPVKSSRWYSLVSGGDGPHYVLVTDRNSWADMQGPELSMSDMLKQAYGDDKVLQDLLDCIHHTHHVFPVTRSRSRWRTRSC